MKVTNTRSRVTTALCVAVTVLTCILSTSALTQTSTVPLVTEAETRIYGGLISPMATQLMQSEPGSPDILWISPDMSGETTSPFDIQMLAVPQDYAQIDWSSLRVLYGTLRFDITDRIVPIARFDNNQVFISNVKVPQGTHRLLIQITDTQQRRAQRELILRVTGGDV